MDEKNDDLFKQIIARRDPRYDGRFYFGVKTTGIYCRPVCPAKPKPENILIFRSPSEAERAGYRACLRCHPDLAPGMKMPEESERLVAQALRVIQSAPSEELDVPSLADSLGVSDRHLRRVFDDQLGASPVEILITQRLHFAKQMIQETAMPMTEIAWAAGFRSIRRFNEAFQQCYRTSPSAFRKAGTTRRSGSLLLRIPIRLPYDWESVLAYLRRHETFGVERVVNNRYRRFIVHGKKIGVLTVSHKPGHDFLTADFLDIPLMEVRVLLARVKNLFDTDHNPLHLPGGVLDSDGIRVPGSFDPFEAAVSIILSQLVSTDHARLALKKLILRFGRKAGSYEGNDVYEFPSAKTLSRADIARIGLPKARARAIGELARLVHRKKIDFAAHGNLIEAKQKLLAIHGIGPWTATMIAMRCLNDVDAFPEFDLVIQRVLQKKEVNPAIWASSRAYLTHSIWRDHGRRKEKLN